MFLMEGLSMIPKTNTYHHQFWVGNLQWAHTCLPPKPGFCVSFREWSYDLPFLNRVCSKELSRDKNPAKGWHFHTETVEHLTISTEHLVHPNSTTSYMFPGNGDLGLKHSPAQFPDNCFFRWGLVPMRSRVHLGFDRSESNSSDTRWHQTCTSY